MAAVRGEREMAIFNKLKAAKGLIVNYRHGDCDLEVSKRSITMQRYP